MTYLSTHPGVNERRFMVDRLVQDLPLKILPEEKWERVSTILRAKKGGAIQKSSIKKGSEKQAQERQFYLSGLTALKSGNLNEALAFYQDAIRLAPERAIYHADLSEIYMKLQQADLAKKAALQSIQISQKSGTQEIAMPYFVLGMIAQSEENHAYAVSRLETAKKLTPGNPIIYFQLARSYHALSKKVEASFYLGRYHRLSLEPEKALLQFKKALALLEKESPLKQKIQAEIRGIQAEGV